MDLLLRRMRSYPGLLAAGFLLALVPTSLKAQLVTNPRIAEFLPPSNQNTLGADGKPMVTRYELQFYMPGAAAPFQTGSLGKPAAAADGMIRVTLASVFGAMPSPGIVDRRLQVDGRRHRHVLRGLDAFSQPDGEFITKDQRQSRETEKKQKDGTHQTGPFMNEVPARERRDRHAEPVWIKRIPV